MITYHLLATPSIFDRLSRELAGMDPRVLNWARLEKLPYLTAVILEGLRLSYGIAARLPRVAPDEDLVYHARDGSGRDYVIPRGYANDKRQPELEKHML